jgi:hypothetical protein
VRPHLFRFSRRRVFVLHSNQQLEQVKKNNTFYEDFKKTKLIWIQLVWFFYSPRTQLSQPLLV